MGMAKDRLMELQARGFGEVADKYVCAACFANKGIKDFIGRNATEHFCSYCSKEIDSEKEPIAARLEDVVGLIMQSVRRLYDDPINCLPWDSEEDRYVGIVYDLDEVLAEMGLELTTKSDAFDSLYEDLTAHVDNNLWTPRDGGILSESESCQLGWERFVRQVKHYSRYVFSLIRYKPEPYESQSVPLPSQMLPRILRLIERASMIRVLKKGTILYRIRVCSEGENVKNTAIDLGVPISEKAKVSNRMSPAGIPMFYGSFDKDTAKEEVRGIKYTGGEALKLRQMKIAEFKLLRDIAVVDFTRRHEYCLFEEEINETMLNTKSFLNHFVIELSKPIEKDGREHIEYVPTQIITEYLKYKCKDLHGKRVKGILYPSARCNGVSCVLFLRQRHCVDKGESSSGAFLQLIHVKTIEAKHSGVLTLC